MNNRRHVRARVSIVRLSKRFETWGGLCCKKKKIVALGVVLVLVDLAETSLTLFPLAVVFGGRQLSEVMDSLLTGT